MVFETFRTVSFCIRRFGCKWRCSCAPGRLYLFRRNTETQPPMGPFICSGGGGGNAVTFVKTEYRRLKAMSVSWALAPSGSPAGHVVVTLGCGL